MRTYARERRRRERIAPPAGFTGLTAVLSDGSVFIPFAADLSSSPGHVVAPRFWAYINRQDLFPGGWLHDVGLPITEPLEALVDKGPDKGRRIIVQAFQRTILTDDPLNPPQWQIERANAGTDYACAFPERAGRVRFCIGRAAARRTSGDTVMTVGDWLSVIVARLVRGFDPLQVILFGSQATGEARLDSDIDLLVVLPQLDHKRNTAVAMLRLLSDVPIPVDVIPTDPEGDRPAWTASGHCAARSTAERQGPL